MMKGVSQTELDKVKVYITNQIQEESKTDLLELATRIESFKGLPY